MVDVYREKPIRLVVKVTVPVKEHPKVTRELFSVGKKIFAFLCLYSGFVIACWVHFISKSTFCVKQKNDFILHNLNISVILIFQ